MTVPIPSPVARPSRTPDLYAFFKDLLYFSTARFSPVKDATCSSSNGHMDLLGALQGLHLLGDEFGCVLTVLMEPMVCSTTTDDSA